MGKGEACLYNYKEKAKPEDIALLYHNPGHLCHCFETTVPGVNQHVYGLDTTL